MSIREHAYKAARYSEQAWPWGLLSLAAVALAIQFWPQKRLTLPGSITRTTTAKPGSRTGYRLWRAFDHNGKTAVIAEIYSYDNGSKTFALPCRNIPTTQKNNWRHAIADATARSQPADAVPLLHDALFMEGNTLVKLPGHNNQWIPYNDPRAHGRIFDPLARWQHS